MTTKTADPDAADRTATAARQAADEAERAIAGGKQVSLDKLTELVTRARHADLTAAASREEAERNREHACQEALTGLGAEIDTLAAVGAEGLAEALADIADAMSRAQRAAEAWDTHLAEVASAARDLNCSAPAPGGPREADQRVAVTRDRTIYHGETALKPIGSRLETALQHALDGDVVSAVASVEMKTRAQIQPRADHYVRGTGGMILPIVGNLDALQLNQVRSGRLVELNEGQIRAYLAGDPVKLTKTQERAYEIGRR
jgi:hypothetical protein